MTEFKLTDQQLMEAQNYYRRYRNIGTTIGIIVLIAFVVFGLYFTTHVERAPGIIVTVFGVLIGVLTLWGSLKNVSNGYWSNIVDLRFFFVNVIDWRSERRTRVRSNVDIRDWVHTFSYIDEAGEKQQGQCVTPFKLKDFGKCGDVLVIIRNANGVEKYMPKKEFRRRLLREGGVNAEDSW